MRIGDVRIDPLVDGELVLPGPSFYPGTTDEDWLVYRRFLESVDHEPVHMNSLGGYLLRWDGKAVVVDCGVGPIPTAPFRGGGFRTALASLGVARADVAEVIFTHLHFDHIGWATIDGKPYFPNATYRVDKRDWDHYCGPGAVLSDIEAGFCNAEVDAPSVRLAPVADRMEFFQGEMEVIPGINAYEAAGHTPGETVLEIRSAGERGLLLGDLVHAQPELIDEQTVGKWEFVPHHTPDAANAAVERFRKMIVDERLPFAAAHFAGLRWARIEGTGAKRTWLELPV
jgi:glyoxylase-like metal-dependent hydrolase (beta-lactamase superfamily II)